MTEMQKERLNDLIKRLENGEYKQAKGMLRVDDRYCISGVMCDLSGMGEWVEYNNECVEDDNECVEDDNEKTYLSFSYNTPNGFHYMTLEPSEVSKHFGLNMGASGILTQANDDGASFIRMAHALRIYLEDNGESTRWLKILNVYYCEN